MFAGIPELLIILVVIFAAWHIVKAFNRMQQPTPPRPGSRTGARSAPKPGPQAQAQPGRMIEAEDLVSCRTCGTYIAASARNCGRAGCPQPR